jgi:hypothetical protein
MSGSPSGRIRRRAFGLFGGAIAETPRGRTHIPEVAAYQIALACVIVQHPS